MKDFIKNHFGFSSEVVTTTFKVGTKPKIKMLILLVLLTIVLVVGIWIGKSIGPEKPKTGQVAAVAEAKPQVWTCSMHPQIKLPKPGLCPICNMSLIPLTMDDALDVSFEIPGESHENLVCQVLHVSKRDKDTTASIVGLKFISPDPSTTHNILNYIWQRLRELYPEQMIPVRRKTDE